jgi:hypothetical protein
LVYRRWTSPVRVLKGFSGEQIVPAGSSSKGS